MAFGGYTVDVQTTKLPQKVATGFNKCFENMMGASYEMIAYLGSKVVNGVNHAFLAKQTLIVGNDVKSIVFIILNEKPGDVAAETFSIVEISTLMSNGGGNNALGGISINPTTEIPDEAKAVFNKHFGGFLGANNIPFALLATQMVHGGAYFFAVESTMVTSPGRMTSGKVKTINLVKVFSDFSEIESIEVLGGASAATLEESKNESGSNGVLNYAFTWSTKMWP